MQLYSQKVLKFGVGLMREYRIRHKKIPFGILRIDGTDMDNLQAEIVLDNTFEGQDLVWFPGYKDGKRVYDLDFIKDFIKDRVPQIDSPFIWQRLSEVGLTEYNPVDLIDYCMLRRVGDYFDLEKIK